MSEPTLPFLVLLINSRAPAATNSSSKREKKCSRERHFWVMTGRTCLGGGLLLRFRLSRLNLSLSCKRFHKLTGVPNGIGFACTATNSVSIKFLSTDCQSDLTTNSITPVRICQTCQHTKPCLLVCPNFPPKTGKAKRFGATYTLKIDTSPNLSCRPIGNLLFLATQQKRPERQVHTTSHICSSIGKPLIFGKIASRESTHQLVCQ